MSSGSLVNCKRNSLLLFQVSQPGDLANNSQQSLVTRTSPSSGHALSSRPGCSHEQFLDILHLALFYFLSDLVFAVLPLHLQREQMDKGQVELRNTSLIGQVRKEKEHNTRMTITNLHSRGLGQFCH